MDGRINCESPFTQYHRMHYNSQPQQYNPPQMPEQHPANDFSISLQQRIQANKYAEAFRDQGVTGKNQRRGKKLKIFGIAGNRIRREDCGTSILQEQKRDEGEVVKEETEMLISSKTDYHVDRSSSRQIEQGDVWEQQQLQKLLYSSGSLAHVPPQVMANSTVKPEEICQNQTSKVLAEQTPIKLPQKRQQNISVPSSKTILNNTNSNVFSPHSNNSKFMILDMIQSKTLIQHESPKQSKIQLQSPYPNQKVIDECNISPILLNQANITRQMNETNTKEEFISLPISHRSRDQSQNTKKKNQSEKGTAKHKEVNIKRYLQDYGGYEQQIQKMIDKLEKVAQLKDKEQQIHKELGTLTHKKHQSVTNVSNYYFSHELQAGIQTSKKEVKRASNEKVKKNKVFAQSSSNFKTNSDMKFDRQATTNYQLAKDVEKMEEILSKFKEISQTVSLDPRRQRHQPERSVKDYISNAQSNRMMFQSQKIGTQMNFYTQKAIIHPKAQIQVHLNQSQEIIESQKPTQVQRQLFEDFDKKTTERKPSHLSTEKSKVKCQGKSHIEKSCGCKHEDLAIQIQRLNEKIQHLQRQNKKTLRQAKSVEGLAVKEKKRPKEADEWSAEEEDIPILDQSIPKQKVQQVKQSKRNSHYCSDLKPFSVLKDTPFKRENPSKMNSKSPQNAKSQKHENSFTTQIDFDFLKIPFPKITKQLTRESSDRSIIKFGESMYLQFLKFAITRQNLKKVTLEERINLKIKKYEDCIHFYANNSLEYHLIYYYKGKIYFGEWRSSTKNGDGYKHGYGFYENPRKYTYEGEFYFDKKHGRGTINYKNGDIYQGTWSNGKKQGEGILINVVGDIYKGMFRGGKKNGLGEERLKNGDFYRGQFKDGKLEGEGTYWWTDGSIYRGSFKNGLLHGMGIWMSKQNDYYEGEYRQNKKNGFGTYKWSNGMIFSGNFKDDEQVSLKTIEQQQLSSPKTNNKSNQGIQRGSRFSKKSSKRI